MTWPECVDFVEMNGDAPWVNNTPGNAGILICGRQAKQETMELPGAISTAVTRGDAELKLLLVIST